MPLPPGERLGPYEIVGLLGTGGMGVVYRARDARLGREVAIKVLPDELSSDPSRLERFSREARAVAALNDPHILSVYDVGDERGTPYVVFELLDGETLRTRLGRGPLPAADAGEFAAQAARGLAAAHREGIVHRDVKPENLFLARGRVLKILDFGLAKALAVGNGGGATAETADAMTEPGGRVGTAPYMSPEQARGRSVDHRSDLFSLGVVLHEMLGGASPFRRETAAETIVAILKEEPGTLAAAATQGMPGLRPILARCLAKDPEERFQSAADLDFVLRQALGSADSVGSPRARGTRLQRSRVMAGLVVLALAAAAAALLVGRRSAPEPPSFRQLTARTGVVTSARFSSDGQSVFFSGTWGGDGMETLEQRLDELESRALALPPGRVVGAAAGELAILSTPSPEWTNLVKSTLVRVPARGAGARVVAEGVRCADWARDGSTFAIVRQDGGVDRLEYPPGRALYTSPGTLSELRISPNGRRVAFLEQPVRGETDARLGVVDGAGQVGFLAEPRGSIEGIAWSPDGQEIWISGWLTVSEDAMTASLAAVTLSGRTRLLLRLPGPFRLLDVSPPDRVLLAVDERRVETAGRLAGDDRERDLSFRDWTFLMDLSADGRTILFSDRDPRVGTQAAFLRRAAEPQPVRLDLGEPQSLSPDGSRVTLFVRIPESLRVIPTRAGTALTLPRGSIAHYFNSRWLPDGRRLLVAAQEKDRPKRLFLQDVPDGLPQPVTPEGVTTMYPAISPDGRWVAAGLEQPGSLQQAWPLDGGDPRPLRGLKPGDWVVRWSGDGRFVFAYENDRLQPPWSILRVDLETGHREVWKELQPRSSPGATFLARIHVTPDGQSYGYTFKRAQSQLHLVTGLR
jgi:dipeptidyl aminopeptidase/acylaminoacyl peptidase